MEFLDDYKINKKVQSKKRVNGSRKLRVEGEKILQDLALTDEDVENIFDILEEELPEL
jgi:lipase chaperone LimK